MYITKFSIKNPYFVISATLVIIFLGLRAYFFMPIDLFPDTNPPKVAVIVVKPGATAKYIEDRITDILEKELKSIELIENIISTSRDGVSSIICEFSYEKDINNAVVDVTNVVSRLKASLPDDILEPRIFKITDSMNPLMTIAVYPKKGSLKVLKDVRLLCDNQIRVDFLNINGVAEVQVFGGEKRIVRIGLMREKLRNYNISIGEVVGAILKSNINIPSGYIYTNDGEYLIKIDSEFKTLDELKRLIIVRDNNRFIRLKDIAIVSDSVDDARSMYFGNGNRAIAINILRADNGSTSITISNIKKVLPLIKSKYPDLNFEITDTQERIITQNVSGMKSSIIASAIMTILVIFIFLADFRASMVIAVSIPLSFLGTLSILRFTPYTLNMVTLSGVIIAIGMVVDASVVVLENIYRHYKEKKSHECISDIVLKATHEVGLSITAGMLTTIIVLIPIMFVGGYPEKVLRPLSFTMSSTLIVSLIIAITIIPLLVRNLFQKEKKDLNIFERFVSKFEIVLNNITDIYISILRWSLNHRKLVLIIPFIFLIITVKKLVIPNIGRTLMPRMDTGIIMIKFDLLSGYNIDAVKSTVKLIENEIKKLPGYISTSTVIGAESNTMSFGTGGATLQSVLMKVTLIDRMHRKETIWELENRIRDFLNRVPKIKSFEVFEYGATPLSTIKAPIDIIIYGKEQHILSKIADKIILKLKGIKGLVDIRKSWYFDRADFNIEFNHEKLRYYGLTELDAANQIKQMIGGVFASKFSLKDYPDIPIKVELYDFDKDNIDSLKELPIFTKLGIIPLRTIANVKKTITSTFITRERLRNTIDITTQLDVITESQAVDRINEALKDLKLPYGYNFVISGTIDNMNDALTRIVKALIIGIVLLYLLLANMFKSLVHPITIIFIVPLSLIGAFWGLLIVNEPMCMPAMMGIILLGGTIVNNSILLLDFILRAVENGSDRTNALINSVRLRIRPIFMTTISTIIGMIPLILKTAVGLERMSPLGTVAAFGLAVGTLFTMVVIPVFYTVIDDIAKKV